MLVRWLSNCNEYGDDLSMSTMEERTSTVGDERANSAELTNQSSGDAGEQTMRSHERILTSSIVNTDSVGCRAICRKSKDQTKKQSGTCSISEVPVDD
jgi:hypothetical protein